MAKTLGQQQQSVFVPFNDQVAVRKLQGEEVSVKGVIIPDNADVDYCRGEVVSVGPGLLTVNGARGEMVLHPGDRILYRSDRGIFIRHEGQDLVVLKESTDIIALIGRS